MTASRRFFLQHSLLASSALVLGGRAEPSNTAEQAHWYFDPASKSAVDKASGLTDPIICRTCNPGFVEGVAGPALRLDGYSVWFRRDGSAAPALGREFSIALWTALESYPVSAAAFVNQRNAQDAGYFFGLDQFGFLRLELSVDGEWRRCVSTSPVPRFQWVYLAASLEASGLISLYLDGTSIGSNRGRAGSVTPASDVELLLGKTNGSPYVGGLFATGVLNGFLGDVVISTRPFSAQDLVSAAAKSSRTVPVAEFTPADEFKNDSQRPLYHAMPPRAWTNEPHGLIRFKGEHHLFYQKNANGPYWGQINWGHMVSPDLIHWKHLEPALSPAPGLDAAGCWSGSVIEHHGQLAIIYTAGDGQRPTICLAASEDGVSFTKSPHNPIIASSPAELNHPDFRDPFVWAEGDGFYMIIGSGIPNLGGTALLYKSTDLVHWTFLRKLLQGSKADSGTFWEMPVFFPLGEKHVLMVTEVPGRDSYWIGQWKEERFYPDQEQPTRLELVNHFLSPTPYRDEKGRTIVIGIIPETRRPKECWDAGWAHLYSLPRVLSLDSEGALQQRPLPELQTLRGKPISRSNERLEGSAKGLLHGVTGVTVEIAARFKRGDAPRTGLRLRRSADGQEETLLYYDWTGSRIVLDRTKSSIDPDVRKTLDSGAFPLRPGEALELHVFLDNSVLEVFVNGRGTIGSRIYPTRRDSDSIDVFSEGGSSLLQQLDIWPMNPA